ncbi:MAG: DRTGG domain-containing protein [Bacteroidales bacterium]|nr:DRTGG domain-containing protein [Bacteroidales bacterium]
MTVAELTEALDLQVFSGDAGMQREITGGYVSDLLSDVMGRADEGQVWITLQTHKNVMAIASLKELAAVILVNDNKPAEDTAQQSNEEGIPILGTSMSTFEVTGKIYELIKK